MKLSHSLLAILLMAPLPASARQTTSPVLDAQHRELAALEGSWSVKQSIWAAAGAPPKVDHGTAAFAMVLNRRHLRQTLRIADGTGFEGLGYIGYDNAAGQFFSTWMDVNFPGLVVARGGFDARKKAYVFEGSMSAPSPVGAIPVREVLTIIDRDHFSYEYFEARDGAEMLTVRLEYSRDR
jgi:hypothetical protein